MPAMLKRVCLLVSIVWCCTVAPAAAQDRAEVAIGAAGSWRDGTRGGAPGAALAGAYRFDRVAVVAEASGVRREGHNDWRLLGGARVWLRDQARSGIYAQGLAGSLIRNGRSGLALAAGLGLEWRTAGRLAFRLQTDVTRDEANGVRADGVRASGWLVLR